MTTDCQNNSSKTPEIPQLITISQAAPIVGMTPWQVLKLARSGELPVAGKHGRTWLIPLDALAGLNGQVTA